MNKCNENNKIVHLLWTGGWDSTFRLTCLLFFEKKPVQPIYLIDPDRKSTQQELNAMEIIRQELMNKSPEVSNLLLPTKIFQVSEIAPCQEITEKFLRLRARFFRLGSQYDWLARFAEQHQIKSIELSIEKDLRETHFFFKYLKGKLVEERGIVKLGLPVEDNDLEIFKYYEIVLNNTTKLEMMNYSKKHHFYELMLNSWFCHSPINGKPCGWCSPCRDAMKEGFGFRIPAKSRARYYLRKFVRISKAKLHIKKAELIITKKT